MVPPDCPPPDRDEVNVVGAGPEFVVVVVAGVVVVEVEDVEEIVEVEDVEEIVPHGKVGYVVATTEEQRGSVSDPKRAAPTTRSSEESMIPSVQTYPAACWATVGGHGYMAASVAALPDVVQLAMVTSGNVVGHPTVV